VRLPTGPEGKAALNSTSIAPELNVRLLAHLLRYVREHHGASAIERIRTESGIPDLEGHNRWVTLSQFETVLRGSRDLMRDDDEFVAACAFEIDKVSGPVRFLIGAVSPVEAYALGAKNMRLISTISAFELERRGNGRVLIRYRSQRPESRLMCLSRQAQIRALPTVWGLPHADIVEESCVARGDASCGYAVRLQQRIGWLSTAIVGVAGGVGGLALGATGVLHFGSVWGGSVLGFLGGMVVMLQRRARMNRAIADDINDAYLEASRDAVDARRALFGTATQGLKPGQAGNEEPLAHASALAVNGRGETLRSNGEFVPRSGSRLGSYEVLHLLGKGAMGAVFEAEHRWLRRRVALKILRAPAVEGACGERAVQRFLREGRAAAQVRHPHVVEVFDFGFEESLPFLVMELVDGGTLHQLLHRETKLSLSRTVELLLPILSALAELHAAGIVHRDIKPGNILLDDDSGRCPKPKLSDFGLSRLDDESPITQSDAIMGTPGYLAPELARSPATATDRSDQYAVGVILYECTTGDRPFPRGTLCGILLAAGSEELRAPSIVEPSLPAEFDVVVMRALAHEPERRFPSIDDLAAALLPFASQATAVRWRSEFVGSDARSRSEAGDRANAPERLHDRDA
jgi:tRNA A-37 threonylcarbamoyl transferase component Bud32